MNKIKEIYKKLINILCCSIISISPTLALAEGETPVSDGLQYIISSMYGATGVALATIAVMVVGLLCLFHFIRWMFLGYTIMGISIIFGAGAIVTGITSFIHF